jgi:hypothetical protein
MDDEQDVYNHHKMVRIPEGVEPCQSVERSRKLNNISSEPPSCKCECCCHQNNHADPSYTFWSFHHLCICRLFAMEVMLYFCEI